MALPVLQLGLFSFISLLPLCALGANYVIPPGWDPYNSSYYKTHISGEYYVVNNGSSDILSDNGTFALVVDPISIVLSIAMTSNYSPPYIQHIPDLGVSERGPYNHAYGFKTLTDIQLDDCGHIYTISSIYFSQRQSLDGPFGFLLVPMCAITSSTTYWLLGNGYGAHVYDGGFALMLYGPHSAKRNDFDGPEAQMYGAQSLTDNQFHSLYGPDPQIYGAWSVTDKQYVYLDTIQSSESDCLGYKASLVMEQNGSLVLMYRKDPDIDWQPPECSIPPKTLPFRKLDHQDNAPPIQPFIKMTDAGNLVLYKLDVKQQTWVEDSMLILDSICKSVRACGLYSVCDVNGECNDSLAIGTTKDGLRNLSYAREHNLKWSRKGVGYIGTKFLNRQYITTAEECGQSTWSEASFYDHSTEACYQFWPLPMGSLHREENITAFIYFTIPARPKTKVPWPMLKFGISIAAAYLASVILAIAYLPIMQRKLNSINPVKEVESLLSTMQGLPQRFTYMELEAATRGFSTKLGAGAFGSVYEGFIAKDARRVAVKKLNDNGTESAKQFVTEISGIGGVSHYNIVKLCGFCIDGASKKLLVYEFMPNGSLDGWLFGEKTLSWEQRCNIALGTARGLFYLHEECSEPILHLDIKPQNILLDDKFEAKVADFGMAKMLESRDVTHVETNVRGTPGYMAPEWLLHYAATKKCDVYSYGMLLLELIGGRRNIDLGKINNEDSGWYFPAWVVDRVKEKDFLKVVDERMRGTGAIQGAEAMVRVALWCIQENPVARPSMADVLDMLQNHNVEEPPMCFYFDHSDRNEITTDMTSSTEAASPL